MNFHDEPQGAEPAREIAAPRRRWRRGLLLGSTTAKGERLTKADRRALRRLTADSSCRACRGSGCQRCDARQLTDDQVSVYHLGRPAQTAIDGGPAAAEWR